MSHPDWQLREITGGDATAFSDLLVNLARESDYTLLTDWEYQAGAESQADRTRHIIESDSQQLILAEVESDLAGFVAVTQGIFQRNTHVGSLMIGVRVVHHGRGIGSELMQSALDWCARRNIERLELTVAENNRGAIALYHKYGFVQEGLKKDAYRVDGVPVNELMMARYG